MAAADSRSRLHFVLEVGARLAQTRLDPAPPCPTPAATDVTFVKLDSGPTNASTTIDAQVSGDLQTLQAYCKRRNEADNTSIFDPFLREKFGLPAPSQLNGVFNRKASLDIETYRRIQDFVGGREARFLQGTLQALGKVQVAARVRTAVAPTPSQRNQINGQNRALLDQFEGDWRRKRAAVESATRKLAVAEELAKANHILLQKLEDSKRLQYDFYKEWVDALKALKEAREALFAKEREQFLAPGYLFTEEGAVEKQGTEYADELRVAAGDATFAASEGTPNEVVLVAAMAFDELAHTRLYRWARRVKQINEKLETLVKTYADADWQSPERRLIASLELEQNVARRFWARANAMIRLDEETKWQYARVRLAVLEKALDKLVCNPAVPGAKAFVYQDVVAFWADAAVVERQYRNVALLGKSGTGKSTVGDVLGKIYGAAGFYLRVGETRKVEASELTPEFAGQVRAYVRTQLNGLLEGTIFLDEAYALNEDRKDPKKDDKDDEFDETMDGEEKKAPPKSSGSEVLNEVVSFLSDNEGLAFFVVAGYEDKMNRQFFGANEGLDRRFTRRIVYPNASPVEMTNVWVSLMGDSIQQWEEFTSNALCHILCLAKLPKVYSVDMLRGANDDTWRELNYEPFARGVFGKQFGSMRTLAETCVLRMSQPPTPRDDAPSNVMYGPIELYEALAGLAMEYAASAEERNALEREFRGAPIDDKERDKWGKDNYQSLKRTIDLMKQGYNGTDDGQKAIAAAIELALTQVSTCAATPLGSEQGSQAPTPVPPPAQDAPGGFVGAGDRMYPQKSKRARNAPEKYVAGSN